MQTANNAFTLKTILYLSLLQTSKFSMTSFYVTSFICSSVRATLTIFLMTSALAHFARLYGSTKKTCQSNLSI